MAPSLTVSETLPHIGPAWQSLRRTSASYHSMDTGPLLQFCGVMSQRDKSVNIYFLHWQITICFFPEQFVKSIFMTQVEGPFFTSRNHGILRSDNSKAFEHENINS